MPPSNPRKPPRNPQPNPFELMFIIVLVVIGLFYAINALSTRDWGWFLPNDDFNAQPMRVELYHEGESEFFYPGERPYIDMTAALNEQLRHPVANWPNGLRPAIVEEAMEEHTTLIFVYASPVRIHTQWNIGNPTRLLVPVTGAFSTSERVYLGSEGGFGSGAIVVNDLAPLRQLAIAAAP